MTMLDWLLDSDPAIRWQVLRDLTDAPGEVVAAERARVATEGWGAALLALRDDDGQWAGGACFPAGFQWSDDAVQPWTSTLPTLELLREFGLDPRSKQAVETVALVQDNCRWEYDDLPFFAGEVDACINGRTLALGAYFGVDVDELAARLLGEQFDDGGWNCWAAETGSVRSSFHSTIGVLEGLLAHERATGGSAEAVEVRRRGEEYLLERQLFRRLSTGDVVDPHWLQFSFPVR
ncbi:MAG TPA: squalene cyclase, partial [Mycobacteriales bacterium]|nr:squalene cyclase [Mycobacteriales bacterium]